MNEVMNDLGLALAYLVPVCLVWFVGMKVYDKLTPFDLQSELTEKDNPAVSVAYGGFALGLIIALGGLFHGNVDSDVALAKDLGMTVAFGALAVVLMGVSSWINDKVILPHVKVSDELKKGNMAVGLAEAGSFVANGCILYGALSGEGSVVTGLVFWLVAQVVLLMVSIIYNVITKFDAKIEVAGGNTAVGLSYAGFLVAMGIILKAATQGNFVSWNENLTNFAIIVGFSLVVLPCVRLFLDKAILHKADLCQELAVDKNKGVGALEAVFYVSSSLIISWIMLS